MNVKLPFQLSIIFMGTVLIIGCSSGEQKALLDAAPEHSEVRHPEWGDSRDEDAEFEEVEVAEESYTDEVQELASYLESQGINFQVYQHESAVVRLNDTIEFESGKTSLSSQSQSKISAVAEYINTDSKIEVVISGHADAKGQDEYNDSLSMKRALVVKRELIDNDVAAHSVFTRGYGEKLPKCDNESDEGRQCNRRVEMYLILKPF
ncbi:OmpA family protein [Vibrio sp.]|nr:OmpA family protein [Vibrio sp.]